MTKHDYPLSLTAVLVALAALLSGPIGFGLTLLRPQPAWENTATFVAHAHPVQQLPYWFGFVLLVACVLFFARVAALAFATHPTRVLFALACVGIYAAMVSINYALQIIYVPQLVRDGNPVLAYITMANGRAPTWILEMVGYAFLGMGTAIVAPLLRTSPRGRWIRRLFVANGVLSLAGAVVIAGNLAWVMTVPGLVAYLAWNAMFIAMMVLVAIDYRPPHAI